MEDDWFVRCFYEYKRIEGKGLCYFPTLTFDKEHLPIWDGDGHSFPCFDLTLIKRFRDKLRTYLKRDLYHREVWNDEKQKFETKLVPRRKGSKLIDGDVLVWNGIDFTPENTIRYICCPEFGGKKGRPHYHMLLFVPFFIPIKLMKEVFQLAWTNGMVMYSPEYGAILSSDRGTQYVMKYVNKPSGWYKKYGIDAYEAFLHNEIKRCQFRLEKKSPFSSSAEICEMEKQLEDARDHYRDFKRHCPRHCQSTYFGVDGVDYFKNEDGSWNIEKLIDGQIRLSSMVSDSKKPVLEYTMPDYYARKIFYQKDAFDLYQRTPLANEVFALRWQMSLERRREKFAPYFATAEALKAHVDYLPGANEIDWSEAFSIFHDFMDGRTMDDLILYDMVYRGIDFDFDDEGNLVHPLADAVMDMPRDMALQFLRDNALDFMIAQRSIDRAPDPKPEKYHRIQATTTGYGFNDLPCFKGFDEVLQFIEETEGYIGEAVQAAYDKKIEEQINYLDIVSPYLNQLAYEGEI